MARALIPAICLAIVACSSRPPALGDRSEPSPTPPDPLPKVATTPLLAGWVSDRVIQYRQALTPKPGESAYDALRLQLEVMPLDAALETARLGGTELVIAAVEPPEGWFATPLGVEAVAVVVHPQNPVRELDLETLRDLFAGLIDDWEAILPISLPAQPVLPLPGDESRTLLEQRVLLTRRATPTSLVGPSPAAIAAMVSEKEGAFGLLPMHAITAEVQVIQIAGVDPSRADLSDGSYPLVLQLVAFAPQEPDESVRNWLVWLQELRLSSDQ